MEGAFRRSLSTVLNPIPHQCVSQRYLIALSCSVLAVILRWLLDPVLGHVAFYVTIHIVVAYCAIVCGYAPAIVTALVGFWGIVYWFVDPRHSLAAFRPSEIHGVVGFVLLTIVLIALGEAVRSKQLRLNHTVEALTHEVAEKQRAQQELRAAHDELEQRVEARTHELSQALSRLEAEMTFRQHTEEQLRHLSLRLMTLQDEERRHIARELHDTCGQTLAAMKMSIALIRQLEKTRPELQVLVDDLNALADEALQEVRTTSYLLHPPLLDEAGIASAARWFLEGFARRSGIDIQVDIPEKMERPDRNCELVLFRVLQESLTNVHRHSGASAASVRLQRDRDSLHLEIHDNGKGIPQERLHNMHDSSNRTGVGIAGMRERVRELGGHLEVRSAGAGTSVHVTLPASHPAHSAISDAETEEQLWSLS
jgi:signal transduction histidine kinase